MKRRLIHSIIGAAYLSAGSFSHAQCLPVVDQEQASWTLDAFAHIGQQECYGTQDVQSFQPSYDNVTGVELRLSQGPGLTFKVGLFNALPNTGAKPLAEASVTTETSGYPQFATANWGRVPVTPGQTYYIGYCWAGGSQNFLSGATGNPYPKGILYGLGGNLEFPDFDFTFKTFSSPCPVLDVAIDIKPGSYPNSINLCSGGSTPVAILGSTELDVRQVDVTSLTLADAEIRVVGKSGNLLCHDEYVNEDQYLDRVCQFYTTDLALDKNTDTSARINGKLLDGTPIVGTDSVNLVKDCP